LTPTPNFSKIKTPERGGRFISSVISIINPPVIPNLFYSVLLTITLPLTLTLTLNVTIVLPLLFIETGFTM
jgi:hypothetical protein